MDLEKSDHLGHRSISTSFLRCAHVNISHSFYLDSTPLSYCVFTNEPLEEPPILELRN